MSDRRAGLWLRERMSKWMIGSGVGVAGAVVAALVVQQQSIAGLRREISALREETRVAAKQRAVAEARKATETNTGVPAEQARMADGQGAGAGEVAKLRQDVEGLKKSAQEFAQVIAAAQAKAAEANVPTKLVPVAEWKNGGRGTAGAALETVLWAATGGDVATLAQGLGFTATARAKADAWFAGLSDATRAQYGSPENVIALMIARDAAALSGMQVLGQRELSPEETMMMVRMGSDDGKTKDDKFLLHRTAEGWKLVLPDPVLERYAKQLAQAGKTGGK